jgi:hypothetical protein
MVFSVCLFTKFVKVKRIYVDDWYLIINTKDDLKITYKR